MKIIDVPQIGKLGLQVAYQGRYGLIRRTWTIPAKPNTLAQQQVRANLQSQAQAYDALTEAQQNAWIAAASQVQSKGTLGQSGLLTGLQLFTKLNCSLLAIGGNPKTDPPAVPTINILPIAGLEITNTGGTIALALTTTASPPDGTMLWGAAPCKTGVRRARPSSSWERWAAPSPAKSPSPPPTPAFTVSPPSAPACSCSATRTLTASKARA